LALSYFILINLLKYTFSCKLIIVPIIHIYGGKLIYMKKKLLVLSALLSLGTVAGLTSCGEKTYEIAVVTDVGQLNDGGFNQGTYEGAKAYAEANGISYKYYQPANGADATDNDRVAAMRQAIEGGAKIIVTPGFLQQSAIATVAAESPEVKFVFVDGWNFGQANVTAISYKEQESGYFAGYAAVMEGYTKLGGTFGGGGTNAACNRFAYGYVQGANAAAVEKKVDIDVNISFKYGSSFSASPELQAQVAGWYGAGTEVVFSCGGSMLQSVKAAAEESQNGKIIGVDVDQHGESERVITSAVKGLSASVQKVLGEIYGGKWESDLSDKCSNLGAADDATGLPTNADAWRFKNYTVEQYTELFNKVKNGQVTPLSDIPETGLENSVWWAALDLVLVRTNIHFEAQTQK